MQLTKIVLEGFAWGTVRMKSAKQRNNLIELAKTKPFSVGVDHFQVSLVMFAQRRSGEKTCNAPFPIIARLLLMCLIFLLVCYKSRILDPSAWLLMPRDAKVRFYLLFIKCIVRTRLHQRS